MLRYGNVAKRMFAYAARIRSRLSLTAYAEGRLWGGTWVSGNKKLRRIFIFIFYSVLILLLLSLPLYILRQGKGEGDTLFDIFYPYIILSQGRGKGDTLVGIFFVN